MGVCRRRVGIGYAGRVQFWGCILRVMDYTCRSLCTYTTLLGKCTISLSPSSMVLVVLFTGRTDFLKRGQLTRWRLLYSSLFDKYAKIVLMLISCYVVSNANANSVEAERQGHIIILPQPSSPADDPVVSILSAHVLPAPLQSSYLSSPPRPNPFKESLLRRGL
jgi:hypothetical protein